ncbi:MarR family winged helix-turn-helix transcriptional regulator [Limosilactobacillus ingluviei]|uniref:MarR family transcriptional regulator n=1 Tax=Limosilactobacillus ingluviei DSM 15946 TaxID=1423760 RepID=A0A0R1U3P0_9LACO|nr:MarR family transcriptional regulator [Limosilactobacillus ingluviei]KRL87927.1 MarR family transcriptional regulator [Limosilactobacillus ingluviei DSM 15946]MBM6727904.1 MarR family transcriptional regulator [Limosilactobacillus ingluviei]MDO4603599.1 MarR family transcriptional regulator [Limosilactobacillus ingluviei]
MNESRDYQAINQALIKVYSGIMWIEEHELRKSTFADLTIKEMHAIDAISMYDHQTASAVAKKLHLTPGTMTATADRLTKKGYVKRVRDEQDRRIVRLYLTKKGRVLYRAHRAFHNMMVAQFLDGMTDEEMKTVRKALRNLENFVDEHA